MVNGFGMVKVIHGMRVIGPFHEMVTGGSRAHGEKGIMDGTGTGVIGKDKQVKFEY